MILNIFHYQIMNLHVVADIRIFILNTVDSNLHALLGSWECSFCALVPSFSTTTS